MTTSFKTLAAAIALLSLIAGGFFITHLVGAQTTITVNGANYNSLEEALQFTLPSERGTVKGAQIAKIKAIPKTQRGDYFIEVVDMKSREKGVDVFVRAWDRNNNQIGFGSDGTVEIERFVVINPPILVPDPNGTVIRSGLDTLTGKIEESRFREDAREALLQSLEHTISVKRQKYAPAYIIPGKIGNTTLTVYPQAGTGTAPIDGYTRRGGVDETFSAIRSGAGTENNDIENGIHLMFTRTSGTSNQFQDIFRSGFGFDTSSIGSNGIDSATLSFNRNNLELATTLGDTDVEIVSFSPTSGSDFAIGDYSNFGATRLATGKALSTFGATSYNDFTLNTDGKAHINKSGNTYFGTRSKWDLDNSAPTWASVIYSTVRVASADEIGTSVDPKLVVEHSLPAPLVSNLQVADLTSNTAIITWSTDISSDSGITYDITSPVTVGDSSVYDGVTTTSHSITLAGLSTNTTYYYFASSTSAAGVTGTSTESSFITEALDLSNVRATNTGSGWTDVKWGSSLAGDSKVWYSLTSPVSATNFTEVYDATATTSHSLYVSGLLHNAIYYYLVVTGSGGNYATSSEKQFNTTSTALCTE